MLLAGGILLRLLVSLAYRPALLLQVDAYSYLNQAFGAGPSGYRPALYPLLLRALLAFGNLAVVPAVQHVLGLSLAGAAYLVLTRLGVGPFVAAAGTAPLLLDGYQLVIEHYVLAETMFDVLVFAALGLLVWRPRPHPLAVGTAGSLLALAGLTRFVGLALIVPALLYVALNRLGWLRAVALVVTFGATVGLYSLWFKSFAGTTGVTDRNGFFLFGRVASFADCAEVEIPPQQRPLCRVKPSTGLFARPGFFALDIPERLISAPTANARFLDFSTRMIRARPFDYVATVGRDFIRFFDPRPPPFQEPQVARWRFPRSVSDARPHPLVRRLAGAPPPALGLGDDFVIDRPLAPALRAYQGFAYTPGPLLGLLALLSLTGAAWERSPLRDRDVRPVSLLFALSGIALLLTPVLVTVHHFRYVLPSLPLLGSGGAVGVALLLARLRGSER